MSGKRRGTPAGGHADPTGRRPTGERSGEQASGPSWVVGFVLRLLAGWALAIGALTLVPGIEHRAVAGTVASVDGVLRAATLRPETSGATIRLGDNALIIIPECTPVMPVLMLTIAMAAYPAPLRWKLAGIGAGIVALWVFNVVRMLALFATLAWWPQSFKFMHVYLWQTITLLVVCGLFLAWLKVTPPAEART